MEIITIISAIISIIILYIFVKMAGNVSAIQTQLRDQIYNEALIDYYRFKHLGTEHYHEAGKALLKAYYSKMYNAHDDFLKKTWHRQMEQDLGQLFKDINYEMPKIIVEQ